MRLRRRAWRLPTMAGFITTPCSEAARCPAGSGGAALLIDLVAAQRDRQAEHHIAAGPAGVMR